MFTTARNSAKIAIVTMLLTIGLAPVGKDLDRPTLAAWTSVARVLMNLHETITRE